MNMVTNETNLHWESFHSIVLQTIPSGNNALEWCLRSWRWWHLFVLFPLARLAFGWEKTFSEYDHFDKIDFSSDSCADTTKHSHFIHTRHNHMCDRKYLRPVDKEVSDEFFIQLWLLFLNLNRKQRYCFRRSGQIHNWITPKNHHHHQLVDVHC